MKSLYYDHVSLLKCAYIIAHIMNKSVYRIMSIKYINCKNLNNTFV